ncbi:MAG: protein phosphatase 2C domain-containing protein [Alphaproteobacteria bacterium]|nr:protein phosphatase 2C domain-containing protein [Alphaproteobacteria bacterium]
MKLQLLDSLSLPGDPGKANEDAFGHDAIAAVVIDGATPLGESLMPGPSDAAWIAQFGARRLMAHLKDGDGARKALRAALADTQKSFEALRRQEPQEMWQMPCGSMMLAVPGEASVEFLWFGDCAALIKQGDAAVTVIGESFDKRAGEAARAQQVAKEKKLSPAAGINRPEFLLPLRAARNGINSGNHWLFSPDVKAAAHVSRRLVKAAPGSTVLLASDGLLALASDYGAYNADSLMAAAMQKGLAALGTELRAIEAGDAVGDKFPRFKKGDDATGLLLRLT